ncbi:MAG: hypothetical protein IT479_07360 [Xanthomonadales bacterium]|nr:hypothetical protein [Xanthomonadales bacterium]MCC6593081.1 hypothetical protein [Xanthomonadales bacterium]MCE7930385.1 hypothetical protein [Xanthomonadales bacterium PRO6]
MRTFQFRQRPSRIAAAFVLTFGTGLVVGPTYAAQPGAVDLLATPPELTASVAPNVLLTFDDSGSMAWQYMPDQRPFDGVAWGQSTSISTSTANPWFCAGRIDASVTDPDNPRSKPMNGMYYDPNVTYRPPLLADGVTQMPNASFTAAWHEGIAHNRPNAPVVSGTRNLQASPFCRTASALADPNYFQLEFDSYAQDWDNTGLLTTDDSWAGVPHLVGYSVDRTQGFDADPRLLTGYATSTIDLKANATDPLVTNGGVYEIEGGTQIAGNPTLALQGSDNHDAPYFLLRVNTTRCTGINVEYRLRDLNNLSTAAQQIAVQARVGNSGAFTNFAYHANANTGSDTPGTAALSSSFDGQQRIEIRWITTNATGSDNMIGVDDIKVTGSCTPTTVDDNAGWYRLKDTVTVTQDSYGIITSPLSDIYTATNWEFVPLPIGQRQNFANWYSYYRSRTNSAKTAMSRAFAPFNEAIRVAWQNLHTSQIQDTAATFGAQQKIFRFIDETATANVRTRFYDWLFQIPASGGTPNIAATNRVGEFFKRGQGYDNDTDPYYDNTLGRELSCRQNFHINMSDGFWNGGNPAPTAPQRYLDTGVTLPDGRAYSTADAESRIMHRMNGTQIEPTLSDVMFHYWATDLRPDFTGNVTTALRVPPFIPDRSTTLFGTPLGSGQDPRDNKEIYWNPANDPATWAHMVNFNISFGLSGTLPQTQEVYDSLREGTSTIFRWPYPSVGTDDGRKLDDFWHAALVSRGRFLSAKNPEELITSLQEVIASIIARRGASTAVSVSLPIITDGTTGYTAGYDTTDWSGFVTRNELDQSDASIVGIDWDAACLLTGGACPSTAQTGLTPRDPSSRAIYTSSGTPGTGVEFLWGNLTSQQQARLNVDPSTLRLDLGTWTADTFGDERVAYLRGDRTHETTPSPRFRVRGSVLGAVIRGQPIYVSSPTAGIPDLSYPTSSPEYVAAAGGNGYREFQNANRNRQPMIYVGANDGMLHAFDAHSGTEEFAYVPNTVIENFRLTRSTLFEGGLTPTVDDKPLVTDVYINNQWKTILLGSMRLGGRGVYLLDITDPTTVGASTLPLWEFSNVAPAGDTSSDCATGSRHCSSLGYTYDSVNVARIGYQDKWVALVSSGYFPKDSLDPASNETAANRTSLLVIDLETGQLIREILTSTAPQAAMATRSFGLSQPAVMDVGSDFIDDVAIAGDLAGNLWRFDLTGDPADWSVDLMFRTYGAGGGNAPGVGASAGDLPISSISVVMTRGPETNLAPIVIFGSGKFLGMEDRTAAIPQQSFYGIHDYGTCGTASVDPDACSNYPVEPNELKVQKLSQAGNGVRSVCGFGDTGCTGAETPPAAADLRGWRIRLNIPSEAGERSFSGPFPFFTSNAVLLRSIIPKGVDPCDPGARYGLMVVDAATGGLRIDPSDPGGGFVGGVVSTSTPPGDPITLRGGGDVVIAGLTQRDGSGAVINAAVVSAVRAALSRADDIWHRSSWREILDD